MKQTLGLALIALVACIVYGACVWLGSGAVTPLSWRHAPLVLLGGLVLMMGEGVADTVSHKDRVTDPLALRVLRLAGLLLIAATSFALLYFIGQRM